MNGIPYISPTKPMTPIMTMMAQVGGSPLRSRPVSGRVSGTNLTGAARGGCGVGVLFGMGVPGDPIVAESMLSTN